MATNSNNNGGNGQRPAGSGRKPSGSAQRPTGQRPAGSGQRPAGSGQRTGAANGQKRMSAKQRAAKKRKKVIIFGIEIVVILFMVALLYLVMTHTSNEGPKVTVLETEELQIPEEVQQDETMKGYMNIAQHRRQRFSPPSISKQYHGTGHSYPVHPGSMHLHSTSSASLSNTHPHALTTLSPSCTKSGYPPSVTSYQYIPHPAPQSFRNPSPDSCRSPATCPSSPA